MSLLVSLPPAYPGLATVYCKRALLLVDIVAPPAHVLLVACAERRGVVAHATEHPVPLPHLAVLGLAAAVHVGDDGLHCLPFPAPHFEEEHTQSWGSLVFS